MKQKQTTHWLKVAVIGIALGFALQFVRAWTEPTTAPPGGNAGAPINTSNISQAKGTSNTPRADKPGSIVASDFCLPGASGKCLSTAGSSSICNNNGVCDAIAGENYTNCLDCPLPPTPTYYKCPDYHALHYCYTTCLGQTQLDSTCWFNYTRYMAEGVLVCVSPPSYDVSSDVTVSCDPI